MNRFKLILFTAIIMMICAGTAFAQSIEWPTYHYDHQRTGQNNTSTDLLTNPDNFNLIWVYPRGQVNLGRTSATSIADRLTVDDLSVDFIEGGFDLASSRGITSDEGYESRTGINLTNPNDYHISNAMGTPSDVVSWNFPSAALGLLPTDPGEG